MITEETCPGAVVTVLGNGVKIRSQFVKYAQTDMRDIVISDGGGNIEMNFGRVWFGPTLYFAHDPDGTVRRCDPMAEMAAAFTPKRKTWLQRIFG
jgi:hypothetical protein